MRLGETQIITDKDILKVREIIKNLCEEIGFNIIDTIRIGTVAIELTRNLYEHASGGLIIFEALDTPDEWGLELTFEDKGRWIKEIDKILDGSYKSEIGLGIGLIGAKKLMDKFEIKTNSSGTTIKITKFVKKSKSPIDYENMQNVVNVISEETALQSLKEKNREMLLLLEELKEKNEQLFNVNQELQKKSLQLNEAMNELEQSNYEIMETMTALEQAKRKLESIIETVPDGILVTDKEGIILSANITFKELFRHFIGKDLTARKDIKDFESESIFFVKLLDCIKNREELSSIMEPEKNKWFRYFSKNVYSSDSKEPFAIIIEISDITPFIEFKELRKQFISTVSHELRTPITAINLSISNLKKYKNKLKEEEETKIINMIEQSSEVLAEIIDDLLILSKIDAQKMEFNFEKIDLMTLVDSVIFQLKSKIDDKKININNELINNFIVVGDPVRISQVFRILIDNAIKYSPQLSNITIAGDYHYKGKYNKENKEGALVRVIDQGIGINPKDINNLFTRFFRSSDVAHINGTGLGLPIAKEIIELHSGNIFVESEYGKGAVFMVFLPSL